MFVQVLKVLDLAEREFTDHQGVKQRFYSKGFLLQADFGQFYAEAIQETALSLDKAEIKPGMCGFARVYFSAREYSAQNGTARYSNDVTLAQLSIV